MTTHLTAPRPAARAAKALHLALLITSALLLSCAATAAAATPGTISTVAGTGTTGATGSGGPAIEAVVEKPYEVDAVTGGGFLIADNADHRVREVDAAGAISTVAGTGVRGTTGDGGPATSAQLRSMRGIAVRPDGGFLITAWGDAKVRAVSPDGVITSVAGPGARTTGAADLGDGGPASSATLSYPAAVATLPDGGFLIADSDNDRIRRVLGDVPVNTVAPAVSGTPVVGSTLACSTGTWRNAPSGYAFTWAREDGTVVATTPGYAPAAAAVGHGLTCTVVASNDTGPGKPAASATTAAVTVPPVQAPPATTPIGPISGPALPAPSNRFTVGKVTVGRDGSIRVRLTLPGAGKLALAATTTPTGAAHQPDRAGQAADLRQPHQHGQGGHDHGGAQAGRPGRAAAQGPAPAPQGAQGRPDGDVHAGRRDRGEQGGHRHRPEGPQAVSHAGAG